MKQDLFSPDAKPGDLIKPLWAILIVISIIRAGLLSLSSLDLYVDEIQYWWWSQELDWGYYSKPPGVAALIYAVTSIFGSSVYTIKLGAILVYPLSSYVIYLLGRKLVSESVGFWSGVLFITLPGIALSSTITSTDVLLFLFWSSAMLFFIRSIETNQWRDWLLCAVVCGLGLLTKYNMAIFALSALGYMLFFGHIKTLKNPRLWIMAAIALLILAPNMVWNYHHDFPTFSHTAEYVDKQGLYPGKMFSFLLEQAGILGPVGYVVFWWWMAKGQQPRNLLINFGLPMLAIISLVALQGKYNANWAAPAYVAFIIGIAHFLQNKRKWLLAMLISNLALGLLVQLVDPILQATNTELNAKQDPFRRVRGWQDWGEQLQTYIKAYPEADFVTNGRSEITEAMFYGFGEPSDKIRAWAPGPVIKSHFELTRPLTEEHRQPMLFLTRMPQERLEQYFDSVELLGEITRQSASDRQSHYQVYYVEGFNGYDL